MFCYSVVRFLIEFLRGDTARGFVFDGIALFGKYQDDSNLMDGANETVDEFGGHSHDDYEYHYHANSKTVEQQAGPDTYTFEQNYPQTPPKCSQIIKQRNFDENTICL